MMNLKREALQVKRVTSLDFARRRDLLDKLSQEVCPNIYNKIFQKKLKYPDCPPPKISKCQIT